MSVASTRAHRQRSPWLILALTWLAFALRVGGLTAQSFWRDEVDALRFATQALPALLEMFRRAGENGPLFFLSLRPWLQVAGTSEFALRFPSAVAGTMATPVIYALICRLTRQRGAALIAAALLATAPYAVWYGQEAKMYAALLLWMPLAIYLTVRASWDGGLWRWFLLYCVTSLGFYLHLLAALAVPAQAVWLVLLPSLAPERGPSWARRRLLIGLLYLALLLLPYLPLEKVNTRDLSVLPAMEMAVEGSARKLAAAAEKGDMAGAAEQYGTMTSGCVACHAHFRGQPGTTPRLRK